MHRCGRESGALVALELDRICLAHVSQPFQVERLWQKMYQETALWGRRGVTIAAIGAVEMALWDITGKLVNRPVSELIWEAFAATRDPGEIQRKIRPYATV